MEEALCTDKPDSLADKADSFKGKRDEEGLRGPHSQKALPLC